MKWKWLINPFIVFVFSLDGRNCTICVFFCFQDGGQIICGAWVFSSYGAHIFQWRSPKQPISHWTIIISWLIIRTVRELLPWLDREGEFMSEGPGLLIDWLIDWLIDGLIDWWIDRLIDWFGVIWWSLFYCLVWYVLVRSSIDGLIG